MADTASTSDLRFAPRAKLEAMARSAQKLAKRVASAREEGEKVAGKILDSVETGGTAAALGYAHFAYGKNGELSMVGVPADLAVAVAGHVAAFAVGKHERHLENIANGAFALWAGRYGMKLGASALAKRTGAGALGARPATVVNMPGAAVGVPAR